MPCACAASTRLITSSNAFGVPIQSSSAVAFIFTAVKPGTRLEQEEIFGPVLSVVQVDTPEEAFAVNNGVKYGLSSSLYTRDLNVAFRAMEALDNGINGLTELLERLTVSLGTLDGNVASLQESMEPVGRLVDKLPGGGRR